MPNHEIIDRIRQPLTFDRVMRILFSLALLFTALWLINVLSSVLLPFVVAWLVAYLLEPWVQRNRRVIHAKGRFWAVMITLLELVLMVVVLGALLLPSVFEESHQVALLIKRYTESDNHIAFIPAELHDFLLEHIDFRRISDSLTNEDLRSIFGVLDSFIAGGVSFVMAIFDWFLVILYVIFIMLDYERLLMGMKHMVPPRMRHTVFSVFDDVKDSMNHYFRGQSFIAVVVGVCFSIGFLIVGIPLAVVLGLFIGLLNMVPYLQLISIPITTILCLVYSVQDNVEFWPLWWACMAVYVVVQCFQDLILTPKVMGKAMGLNPAIILLSLSVWGTLLGFIGLIIALPLTTLLISYYNHYVISPHDGEPRRQRIQDVRAVDDAIDSPLR